VREGAGHPKLKASERRRRTAIVRLTDEEKRTIKHAARLKKEVLSEWIRQTLLASAPPAYT
jgi:hypothetical protein